MLGGGDGGQAVECSGGRIPVQNSCSESRRSLGIVDGLTYVTIDTKV